MASMTNDFIKEEITISTKVKSCNTCPHKTIEQGGVLACTAKGAADQGYIIQRVELDSISPRCPLNTKQFDADEANEMLDKFGIHPRDTNTYPATLLCDFYKVSHREQYPEGTELIYSTWIPRSNKYYPSCNKVVAFWFQAFIKKYLIDYFNENFFNKKKKDIIDEYVRVIQYALGVSNPDSKHISDLHDLGYLPIKIKALPEGTRVPMRVPMLTVENTHPSFFWLTNYLETLMSCELWQPSTSATIADQYKQILSKYALETAGSVDGVEFQGHDFSMRGMCGLEAAASSGSGHLLSFVGTDTIPAIVNLEKYYNADIESELVGTSIPATEHSVMCAGGDGADELETYRRLVTKVYPNGLVSIVSDTWDLWNTITNILPQLKDEIMARDGKVVIRPDSGNPCDIICGTFGSVKKIDADFINNDDWALDYLQDEITEDTPHGERGAESWSEVVQCEGKFYKVGISNVQWDRYDKQYYFIDNYETPTITWEQLTLQPAQKGVIELLWDIFGGTVNEQGYKVLDSHIGAIYGDAITPERCIEICERLKAKGFASTNMVYGIGSYTYQMKTRDSFGFAMKSTLCRINGVEKFIYKDPITDDGTKKSLTGAVAVYEGALSEDIWATDKLTLIEAEDESRNLLRTIFQDGKLLVDDTLQEIRARLADA